MPGFSFLSALKLAFRPALVMVLMVCTPAMAQAQSGTPVTEASSALLFALGVLGVLIGRKASGPRPGRHRRPEE